MLLPEKASRTRVPEEGKHVMFISSPGFYDHIAHHVSCAFPEHTTTYSLEQGMTVHPWHWPVRQRTRRTLDNLSAGLVGFMLIDWQLRLCVDVVCICVSMHIQARLMCIREQIFLMGTCLLGGHLRNNYVRAALITKGE
jgi:hypothetical protein